MIRHTRISDTFAPDSDEAVEQIRENPYGLFFICCFSVFLTYYIDLIDAPDVEEVHQPDPDQHEANQLFFVSLFL